MICVNGKLNLTNKPHALYKKPHALYSLRPSGFGRQGCGFNPSPNATHKKCTFVEYSV